jgi:hypothetical protein
METIVAKMGIVVGVIAVCWYIGGGRHSWVRDTLVPIILGIAVGFLIKAPLYLKIWNGFMTCGGFQMIRLGYGNYSPEDDPEPSFLASITHDRGGWWIRAIYGVLVAVVGAIWLKVGGYVSLPKFLLFVAGNGLLGFLVSRLRLPRLAADLVVGAGIGSLVLFIGG